MKKKFLGFLFFLSVIVFLFSLSIFTKGVKAIKLAECSSSFKSIDFVPNSDVLKLLKQEFIYLHQGLESIVFVSQDQCCVLKFLKSDSSLFFSTKKSSQKQSKMDAIVAASQIAYEKAREETSLIYLHMSKTDHLLPEVSIKLPHGSKLTIPIDGLQFVLQKKVKPLKLALTSAYEKGDFVDCEIKIDSFLKMIKSRSHKGIYNKDSNISRNFGFLGSDAVEIDFGGYELNEKKAACEYFRYKERLRFFLVSKCPKMVAYLDNYKD